MPGSAAAISPSPSQSPSHRAMSKQDVVGPLGWGRKPMHRRASLADEANATGSFRAKVAINSCSAGNDKDGAEEEEEEEEIVVHNRLVDGCEASVTGRNVEMTSPPHAQQTLPRENVRNRRSSLGSTTSKGRLKRLPFLNGFFRANNSSKLLSSTSTVVTTPGSTLGDDQEDTGFATPSNTENLGCRRGSAVSWDGSVDGADDCESDAGLKPSWSALPNASRRGSFPGDAGMGEPPEVLYFRKKTKEDAEAPRAADEADDPAQPPPSFDEDREGRSRLQETAGLERSNAQYQEGRDLFRQGRHREALSCQMRALQYVREAKVARELRKQRCLASTSTSWDGMTSPSSTRSLEMSVGVMTQTSLVSVQSQGSRGLETTEMTIEAEEARIRYELAKIRLILHGAHQNDEIARGLRRELYEWAAQGYEEDLILKRRRIQGRRSRAVEVASICHTLGRLYDEKLGAYDDALRCYREALQIESQLLDEVSRSSTPRKRNHVERLTAMVQDTKRVMGKIHYKKGEFDLAMKLSFS